MRRSVSRKRGPKPSFQRDAYLEALRNGHTHSAAAAVAGVTYETARKHRADDAAFADLVEVAYQQGTVSLEAVALERAKRPNGSDTMLIFALKQRGWSDRQDLRLQPAMSVTILDGAAADHEPI